MAVRMRKVCEGSRCFLRFTSACTKVTSLIPNLLCLFHYIWRILCRLIQFSRNLGARNWGSSWVLGVNSIGLGVDTPEMYIPYRTKPTSWFVHWLLLHLPSVYLWIDSSIIWKMAYSRHHFIFFIYNVIKWYIWYLDIQRSWMIGWKF